MIKVYIENLGLNNQNVFKIMKVVNTDNFRNYISDFNESTLPYDICDAINNIAGSCAVALPVQNEDKIVIKINDKIFELKDRESFIQEFKSLGNVDLYQSMKIQDYLNEECSINWSSNTPIP